MSPGAGATDVRFPRDWLDPAAGDEATDLDLAVLLVNSLDLLEEQPDRLTDLSWLQAALRAVGHPRLAADLRASDLPAMRELREQLRAVFTCSDRHRLPDLLNPLLVRAGAVALLTDDGEALRLVVGIGKRGLAALQCRLPAALAEQVSTSGTRRLGVCASDPCRCAFVDRTRAATRRYCCDYCNDRAAARAYRRRKKSAT